MRSHVPRPTSILAACMVLAAVASPLAAATIWTESRTLRGTIAGTLVQRVTLVDVIEDKNVGIVTHLYVLTRGEDVVSIDGDGVTRLRDGGCVVAEALENTRGEDRRRRGTQGARTTRDSHHNTFSWDEPTTRRC